MLEFKTVRVPFIGHEEENGRCGAHVEENESGRLEEPIPRTSSKRLDLQGIRAIAILVVLAFHFFPLWTPNGYLGVDMFLVLSGFLMSMLLVRTKEQPLCTFVTQFYLRRLKRIVPLYVLVILFSLIALETCFPDNAIQTNEDSAVKALLFMSNRPKTTSENYFEMLEIAVDIFTHTWSLSLEVQFYLVVPAIFLLGSKFSTKSSLFYYLILGLISYGWFFLAEPNVAFNNVFARTWQFLVGMIVFLWTDSNCSMSSDNSPVSKETMLPCSQSICYFFIFGLIGVTAWPYPLSADLMRPLTTISTGVLILLSDGNVLLSFSLLNYIGDISFSLYLIHWPFYAYYKLTGNGETHGLFLAILVSVVSSVVMYEFFEKVYTKMSLKRLGVMVIILLLLNVIVLNKNNIQKLSQNKETRDLEWVYKNMDNVTWDDIAFLNRQWSLDDEKNLFTPYCNYELDYTPYGWCRHNNLSSSATHKVAIFGNSWVANHASIFHEECGHKMRSILQGSAYGCEPFYPTGHLERCQVDLKDFQNRIQKEKPDYGFIFTRFITIGNPVPANVTNIEDDPIFRTMKERLLEFVGNIKKKLFILDAIPRVIKSSTERIVPELRNGVDPTEVDKLLVDSSTEQSFELARLRHAQLIQQCGVKCELVDYSSVFFNTETSTFRYFDEFGLEYVNWNNHLTPLGLEKIRHIWTDLCESI